MNLAQHVRDLARALGVRVWVCATCPEEEEVWGEALQFSLEDMRPTVWVSHFPDEGEAYWTALHELGHIATDRRAPTLSREARAWRWALEAAVIEPDQETWAVIHHALGTYRANRRFKRTDEFTSLYAEAERNARV